jgi:hypothetical protein
VHVRAVSSECPKDPPETTIDGPSGRVATPDVTFVLRSDEPGSRFECRIDDAPFAPCDPTVRRTGLPDGPLKLEARAVDPAGLVDPTPEIRSVTIAVPPVITSFTATRRSFRIGRDRTPTSAATARTGTTLRLRVSEVGRLRLAVARRATGRRVGKTCRAPSRRLRSRRACTRLVPSGTLTRALTRTTASLRFSGRIGRRALRPGRYTLTATVTDAAGNVSRPRALTVTVRR